MPAPDVVNAVQSLKADLQSIVTAIGGISPIAAASGGGILSGKSINELMADNTKQLEEVTKSLNKSKDATEKNIQSMAFVTAALATVGPLLQNYAKYSVQLPMQLLSGVQGQVAGVTLGREKDMGQLITGTIAGLMMFLPQTRVAGAIIGGLGQIGGNAILGAEFREGLGRAATRQVAVDYAASGQLGIQQSIMYNYNMRRGDQGARSMRAGGGGSASAISDVLGTMGLGAEDSAQAAFAIMSQGARGYNQFDMSRVKRLTQEGGGAYGFDPVQNAIAIRQSQRLGFSEGEILGASRRTGFHLDQQAAAMQQVRGQTFMLGMPAGNQVFNAATNTTMGQVMGPQAAAGALMQAGQSTAAAATGNEATEMILFQQYQQANPGDSYMDFLEAKSMGSASPEWVKMMAQAGKTFGAMGQMGGLLGVGTGVFKGASKEARGAATKFYRQAAGEIGVEPLTAEEEAVRLDQAEVNRQQLIRTTAMKTPDLLKKEAGDAMQKTHEGLFGNIKAAQDLTGATLGAARVTKDELIPQMKALTDVLSKWTGAPGVAPSTPRGASTMGGNTKNPPPPPPKPTDYK